MSPSTIYLAARAIASLLMAVYATAAVTRRVTDIGLDPLELVLVGTALEASVFVFEIPTGVVADLRSRRLSVCIGYAIIGAGFALEGLATGFVGLLAASIVWGMGWTFVSGAREAWLADEIGPAEAAPVYVRATQLSLLASVLGFGTAAWLGTRDLEPPLFFAAGGMVLLALALRIVMPEAGFRPAERNGASRWTAFAQTFADGVIAVRGRPALVTLLVVGLLAGMSSEAFDRLREIHFVEEVGFADLRGALPVHWFALLNAAALLTGVAVLAGLRRVVDPSAVGRLPRVLFGLYALVGAGALVFALAGRFDLAFIAWCVYGGVREADAPYITSWLNDRLDPAVRATVLSIHGQSNALGQAGGGPVLGALANVAGIRIALVAAAAVLAPTLALFAREGRRRA